MIECDLLLVHPPAYFDFRKKLKEMYWPFFSSGGSEPITPLYENYPVGFLSLKDELGKKGFSVEILNLSTLILTNPSIDLVDYFSGIKVKLIGIDLHWMIHVQGSMEVASFLKSINPDIPIIFGGISSTYYCDELIQTPDIDMVMRGYDTHEPMISLMDAMTRKVEPRGVRNLLWKNDKQEVIDNEFDYLPMTNSCGMNLDAIPKGGNGILDFKDILNVENFGCAHNCGWCGGSRDAFKRINKIKTFSLVKRKLDAIDYELKTLASSATKSYNLYSLGAYSESDKRFSQILDVVSAYPIKNLMIDQFFLTKDPLLEKMGKIKPNVTINLSPQSHDIRVSKLSGRGTYSMEEMEAWVDKALDMGIHSIDIYFFIGMPEQDTSSVMKTIEYCDHLLEKFIGKKVNAFICPMFPFLDPGCNYFEEPDKYGYKVFFKSLQAHKEAMEKPSLIDRLNYETKWMTRKEIVTVSYEAIMELFKIKVKHKLLPASAANPIVKKLQTALELILKVHESGEVTEELSATVFDLNHELFFGKKHSEVVNQAFPIKRKIGARWFDNLIETGVEH
jgi:Fe-S oxidoreductase